MIVLNKRTIIICTELRFLRLFLFDHLKEMRKTTEILIIASDTYAEINQFSEYQVKVVNIARKIELKQDLLILIILFFNILRFRPQQVISLMPKSGLLSAIASFIARVPVRVHIFTGQVWATEKNYLKKLILVFCDKLIAKLSTKLLCDGHSQAKFLTRAGIVDAQKIITPRHGSISGVSVSADDGIMLRKYVCAKHGQAKEEIVFLFLGRLCYDKGIEEVVDCIRHFKGDEKQRKRFKFIFAGQDEDRYGETLKSLQQENITISVLGFVTDPAGLLEQSDFLLLPSHREGFGNVVLEAYKYGCIPIVSNIYGLRDAYVKGQTAISFSHHEASALSRIIIAIGNDAFNRVELASNGYKFLLKSFLTEDVVSAWMKEFGE